MFVRFLSLALADKRCLLHAGTALGDGGLILQDRLLLDHLVPASVEILK